MFLAATKFQLLGYAAQLCVAAAAALLLLAAPPYAALSAR